MKKANILGTEYEITHDLENEERDGECAIYNKHIKIRPLEKLLEEECTDEERKAREKEVMRHELFHALFHEAGAMEWCCDERLVDFMAMQSPKIFKVFQELNIL